MITSHNVKMYRTQSQPFVDHVSFASGRIMGEEGAQMDNPHEFYHMPIVLWARMGCPETIMLGARVSET